jgi:5,10-methylenetetrahydrofolate reductase
MIGGCCGTTPEHIRWMANSVRMLSGLAVERTRISSGAAAALEHALEPSPLAERSKLAEKIANGQVRGLRGGEPRARPRPDERARTPRRCSSTRASTSSTSPTARARPRACRTSRSARSSSSATASSRSSTCAAATATCIGQMAHLLGAHAIGIRNLVVITGDPPKVGDYPEATAVYDLDSIGLLQMASEPEPRHRSRGKRSARRPDELPVRHRRRARRRRSRREIRRLEMKAAAGADLVMTQPVFQQELLDALLARIAHLEDPVLVGVLPLVSYKNAEFLHNEVPGMQIPEQIRERMRRVPRRGGPQGGREDRARDALRRARSRPGRLPHAAPRPLRARARGPRRPQALTD